MNLPEGRPPFEEIVTGATGMRCFDLAPAGSKPPPAGVVSLADHGLMTALGVRPGG